MKKILTTVGGLAVAGLLFGVDVTTVDWAYSQSQPLWDSTNGELQIGEYGTTPNGQVFYNEKGTVYAQEDRPIKLTKLKKVTHLGNKYVDVYKDGSKKEVKEVEYKALEVNERIPEKKTLSIAQEVLGAIANEATAQANSDGYVNSLTLAIDCTETNRGVVTMVATRDMSFVSGATHNGDAMTLATTSNNVNVAGVRAYYRTGADSGNNNVVVDLGSNYKLLSMFNVCLSGTDQTDMVEANNPIATGYGASVTGSVTTITDGAWVLSGINTQGTRALTPDSGETEINDTDHSDGNLGEFGVSYIERASAGSETMGWSWTPDDNHAMLLIVVKPSAGSTPAASSVDGLIWFD